MSVKYTLRQRECSLMDAEKSSVTESCGRPPISSSAAARSTRLVPHINAAFSAALPGQSRL
jgi:hypothetical protein